MDNINTAAAISFVISFLSLACLMFITQRQFYEVLIPKDWLTRLRWIIFATLIASIMGVIPVVVYQGIRAFGGDSELLRGIASITGNISRLATAILMLQVWRYRSKE